MRATRGVLCTSGGWWWWWWWWWWWCLCCRLSGWTDCAHERKCVRQGVFFVQVVVVVVVVVFVLSSVWLAVVTVLGRRVEPHGMVARVSRRDC